VRRCLTSNRPQNCQNPTHLKLITPAVWRCLVLNRLVAPLSLLFSLPRADTWFRVDGLGVEIASWSEFETGVRVRGSPITIEQRYMVLNLGSRVQGRGFRVLASPIVMELRFTTLLPSLLLTPCSTLSPSDQVVWHECTLGSYHRSLLDPEQNDVSAPLRK
jgi:hypothetical protein